MNIAGIWLSLKNNGNFTILFVVKATQVVKLY